MIKFINNFINRGHIRTVKAKKNIIWSFLIQGMSIILGLIYVPLLINYLGNEEYGIWITVSSIVTWFSIGDIGFGHGYRNKFAEAMANDDNELARAYTSTTYALLIIIGVGLFAVFAIGNMFLNWSSILNASPGLDDVLTKLVFILFFFFCLKFFLRLITIIFIADQKPALSKLIIFLGNLLSFIAIFILSRLGYTSLVLLGAFLSGIPVIILLGFSIFFFKNKYKTYRPSLKSINFKYTKDLMDLGLKFFIIQIAAIVIFQTSNLIISRLYGPAEVTPYNIAFKYFQIIQMLFTIVISPYWSAFTEAYVKNDKEWIVNSVKKLRSLWLVFVVGTILLLIFSNFAYKIWVGDKVIVPFSISLYMAIFTIMNSWTSIYNMFLNGAGKVQLQLYGAIFNGVLFFPLALYLGKNIGIEGVVIASCITSLFGVIITPIQFYKILYTNKINIWTK